MFEYRVVDMLPIEGRCIVFTGKVEQGEVHVGDKLLLRSPHGEVGVTVKSLEPSGFRRSGAVAGDNVSIVVEPLNLDVIADGFAHVGGISLQVRSLSLNG
jgi:translation elongation factor EF-1alpha